MRQKVPQLLLIALLVSLPAATFGASKKPSVPPPPVAPLITLGDSAVPLTGPWKFFPGDSPSPAGSSSDSGPLWAQPDFDDSGWTTMDFTPQTDPLDVKPGATGSSPGWNTRGFPQLPGWTARGFPDLTGYAWYRLRVRVADGGQPIELKMPSDFDDAYQVYANGELVGQFGSFDTTPPTVYWPRPTMFLLPSPSPHGDIELALRFYMSPIRQINASPAGGMHEPPLLGLPVTVGLIVSTQDTQFAFSRFGQFLAVIFFLVLAPASLWLWIQNRREMAFLWLFISLVATILYDVLDWIALATSWISGDAAAFWLFAVLGSAWLPGWIMLWWYWFGLTKKRWIPLAAWLMAAANLIVVAGAHFSAGEVIVLSHHPVNDVSVALLAAVCLLLLVVLVEGYRRDLIEGLLATLPVLLLELAALFSFFTVIFHLPYPALHHFGLTVDVSSLSSILMALVVGALVLRRFLRNRVRQELTHQALELDLEQARELQQHVLIPEEIDSPDFDVEVQYHPAQTVGGDFFQTVLGPDGSLLAVIGDVSGKGISAAMLVSVLVGAARTRASDSSDPASMLAVLNQRLIGRSGGHFATCLVAEFQADGRLRIANAGHIAPYLNGGEIALTGSLPLGFAGKVEPSLQVMQLRPGDKLTFLTDGVVEARDPKGEFFGFERTRIICNEPVNEIVRRAQQFGQNDDITVLRVVYTGGRREMFAGSRPETVSEISQSQSAG